MTVRLSQVAHLTRGVFIIAALADSDLILTKPWRVAVSLTYSLGGPEIRVSAPPQTVFIMGGA